ncbi:hypothetical protein BDZ97DRAFT_1919468 [Flammula alnicola]|nr:hypothetical protein BDZ97DRAFT_1919468 [Flammula alnicola]
MSGIRRAFPFLVAAATGIISGIYIFKPLLVQDGNELAIGPGSQPNITASNSPQKSQERSTDKDISR